MPKKGLIIVISAASGAGKTTICDLIKKNSNNTVSSVSCTTRPKRQNEKNGRDYFFVSEEKFKDMIQEKALVEWACVHGYYYGTPKEYLEKTILSGKDILLNIDVQGGLNIKKIYPDALLIFVNTPTMEELEKRLRGRSQDSDKEIKKRLNNAKKELSYMKYYDHVVINDKLKRVVKEIQSIIKQEHNRQ